MDTEQPKRVLPGFSIVALITGAGLSMSACSSQGKTG